MFAHDTFEQTLLEKIKTIYNDTPGLPADKIGPTVGQNSEFLPLCRLVPRHRRLDADRLIFFVYDSGKNYSTIYNIAILGPGRAARNQEHLAQVL